MPFAFTDRGLSRIAVGIANIEVLDPQIPKSQLPDPQLRASVPLSDGKAALRSAQRRSVR